MKRLAYIITIIVFKLFFKVEIIDHKKVPMEGPVIFCANHNSMLDMFFLGYKLKRWIHWMAKEELFRNPIAAYVLNKLGVFPVKRGSGDVGSIKNAFKLLEEGKVVGIFPQGTRINPENIEKVRVKPGAALIALRTGVPIVPAFVQGSYKIFGKMKVVYGDPFIIENKQDDKYSKEELTELSRDIIKRIYALSEVPS